MPSSAIDDSEDLFVLPRPLRRAVRFFVSLGTGRIYIPAHTGTVSAIAFLAATGLYGMSLGGHTQTVAQATTAAAGFAIEDVKVSGNEQTSEIEILQLLGLDGDDFAGGARRRCSPRRRSQTFPGWKTSRSARSIRAPSRSSSRKSAAYGIWQHGSELSVIEKGGNDHRAVARQQVRLAAAVRRARCRNGGCFRR